MAYITSSRPITSRSSRCCRRIQPAPTSSARSRIQDTGRGRPGARGMHVNAPRPFASVLIPFMEGGRSGVRGYALSGGHQTVHSVWGYTCRAFRLPNHTLTPTYSESWVSSARDECESASQVKSSQDLNPRAPGRAQLRVWVSFRLSCYSVGPCTRYSALQRACPEC